MKHFEKTESFMLMNISCDVCNSNCKRGDSSPQTIESANIEADWGYWSDHDGDKYDFDLCESCFLKMINYLKSIAVDPKKLNPKSFLPNE